MTPEGWQPASMSAQLPTCSVAMETGRHGAGHSGAGALDRQVMGNETDKDLCSAL